MSQNDIMPSGVAYAYSLLNSWEEIRQIREQFRENYLAGRLDPQLTNLYISKLTSFWLELYPKIKSREEFGDLSTEFELYKESYLEPRCLADVSKLDLLLREAMEKLKITDFEIGRE